ncbi:MAG: DNA repair exonuclease [Myxococcales bacterium]|nr:DNA repair exonuclease [Myxococcales bacterium]
MGFRFVHAADLHLDTPFRGLGAASPELAERLRDASLDALDRVVAKALDVDAAFVVFAGDLYDGVERGPRAQLRFLRALERLSRAGIPSFVAHGNHDPEGGAWTAIRAWPDGVTVFAPGEPQSVPVVKGGARLATVHGVSYGKRAERENLALRFPVRRGGDGLHVAVLHANVDGAVEHEPYSPCSLADLTSRGMGYWALGHVHRHRVLAEGPTWVVYPGNTQGRSFGAGELGAKGAVVVDVEGGAVTRVTPFATDSARFCELEADVGALADIAELSTHLGDAASALRDAHGDGVTLLVRARLGGRGDLYHDLRRPGVVAAVLGDLRAEAPHDVAWLALVDETRPGLDLAAIRGAHDLRADVVALWDDWARGGLDGLPDALRAELELVGGLPDAAELGTLLDAAAYDVLDRLTPDTEVA